MTSGLVSYVRSVQGTPGESGGVPLTAALPVPSVMSHWADAADVLATAAFRAIRMVVVLLLLFGIAGVR